MEIDDDNDDAEEIRQEMSCYNGTNSSNYMKIGIEHFSASKKITETDQADLENKTRRLKLAEKNLMLAVRAGRLTGDSSGEARALGNLGTVKFHLSKLVNDELDFKEMLARSLVLFRIGDNQNQNQVEKNYSDAEKVVLHNLVLHLMSAENWFVARSMALVELKMQVKKEGLDRVRGKLEIIDDKLKLKRVPPPSSPPVRRKKGSK